MRGLIGNRWAELGAMALLIGLVGIILPSGYYFRVGALVLVSAIAALGLNLLLGYAGQVSLGHAGFVGIGAYAVALLPTNLLIALAGCLVGTLIGVLPGLGPTATLAMLMRQPADAVD